VSQHDRKGWLVLNAVLDPWVSRQLLKHGFENESSILDHGLAGMCSSPQELEQSSPELEFEHACLYAEYQYGVHHKLYQLEFLECYASALSERLGNARRLGDEIFCIMKDFDLPVRKDAEACFGRLRKQFLNV
jgi:hypothetical protein